jgi:hypothetical protein
VCGTQPICAGVLESSCLGPAHAVPVPPTSAIPCKRRFSPKISNDVHRAGARIALFSASESAVTGGNGGVAECRRRTMWIIGEVRRPARPRELREILHAREAAVDGDHDTQEDVLQYMEFYLLGAWKKKIIGEVACEGKVSALTWSTARIKARIARTFACSVLGVDDVFRRMLIPSEAEWLYCCSCSCSCRWSSFLLR